MRNMSAPASSRNCSHPSSLLVPGDCLRGADCEIGAGEIQVTLSPGGIEQPILLRNFDRLLPGEYRGLAPHPGDSPRNQPRQANDGLGHVKGMRPNVQNVGNDIAGLAVRVGPLFGNEIYAARFYLGPYGTDRGTGQIPDERKIDIILAASKCGLDTQFHA